MDKIFFNNGIITTPNHEKYEWESQSVGCVFYEFMKKHSNKLLQIDGATGESDTYASILPRIIRVALKMQEYGILPDDTIAISSLDHINVCVPYFATSFIGAKMVCFDSLMNITESRYLLKQVNPKIIFVGLENLEYVEEVVSVTDHDIKIFAFGDTPKHANFYDLLIPHSKENGFVPVVCDINKTAFIFFSSGSTNMPKAVHMSHRVFLARIAHVLNLDDNLDRYADLSSFYWSTTTAYWTILIIRGYCKLLISNLDNMELIWKAFEKHKPTYLFLTPFVLRRVWHSKPVNANVDYIKTIKVGGAAMSIQEVMQLRQAFPKATIPFGYGATEVGLLLMCPTKTEKDLEFYQKKIGSTGTVLNGMSYKIVDVNTGEVLGPYQKGELKVKTKTVISSRWNDFINESIDDDGWFKTGDVLYYDDDFYFYYVERLKQMVKYRSHHISPQMIEDVLLTKDYVSNVSVIGIPHELDEEHVMAIVELKPTPIKKEDIEGEILRSVEEALGDKFLLRGGIKFVDRIPTTANGKCDVRKLKSIFVKNIN